MRYATVAATRSVVVAAEQLGVPREHMLAALGMRWEDLDGYEARVPNDAAVEMWGVIERSIGDPLVGLRVARKIVGAGQAALFEYTVRSAPTIGGAWNRLSGQLGMFFGADFAAITRRGDRCWDLGYQLPVYGDPPLPRSEECLVSSFVEICRQVAPTFAPAEVCFQHAPLAAPASWEAALGCRVRFEADFYGVRVTDQALAAPIASHDPSLAKLLDVLAKPLLVACEPSSADPAVRVIRELLDRRADVTLDAVARALRTSRRTLQRQLAAAGTSVSAELDRARRDAALTLLRDGRATIAEIAERLGFADPSQLSRAVRRWTGAAPSSLRARTSRTAR